MAQHLLEEKTLTELKQIALEFDLSQEEIAEHGDRRRRSTWIEAIRAVQDAGKTTQEYRELPVIKACNKAQLPTWFDDKRFVQQLEGFIHAKLTGGQLIPIEMLKSMAIDDRRFEGWTERLNPGSLLSTYSGQVIQILMIDKFAKLYYVPLRRAELLVASINAVRRFFYPISLPDDPVLLAATEHIKLMHDLAREYCRGQTPLAIRELRSRSH